MASPHITALAALTKARHPNFTPAQVKSALMNTAHTTMSLDLEGNIPALAKHRGAGRVNAARLANPQLTFQPASVSFGLMQPTETKQSTVVATDVRDRLSALGYVSGGFAAPQPHSVLPDPKDCIRCDRQLASLCCAAGPRRGTP
jgi:subtilisin family serine protease